MHKLEDTKYEQINNILLTVKLSALLFCGIICVKYISNKYMMGDPHWSSAFTAGELVEVQAGFAMLLGVICLLGIYFVWAIIGMRKFGVYSERYAQTIENIIFMSIFLWLILISGKYESPNKFLFIFIITTSTIQSGMKYGMSVAGVSSAMILLIDLIGLPSVKVNPYFEDDLVLAGIFMLIAWILGYYVKLETEHIEELKDMVNRDGLTGVFNHRYFHDTLSEKIKVAVETNKPLSLLFIDIDNFKYYNDLNGHQKGDEVLRTIGSVLKEHIGEGNIVSRYGGEEFAVLLPNQGEKEGLKAIPFQTAR